MGGRMPHVVGLTRNIDDRGDLAEIWRNSWKLLDMPDIKQVYAVFNPAVGTIRAYHRHKFLWDIFHIIRGSAKFHLVKGPEKFPITSPNVTEYDFRELFETGHDDPDKQLVLSARKPQILFVPPLWWHGWMSLEPNTLLVSMATEEYDRDAPDEERIAYNSFGDVWEVRYR